MKNVILRCRFRRFILCKRRNQKQKRKLYIKKYNFSVKNSILKTEFIDQMVYQIPGNIDKYIMS